MPTFELSDGLTVNFETWGDPESPPVVLLHGFTSDLRMWAPTVPRLSERYFAIASDLRGHGLTSAPEELSAYSIETYASDLAGLLDHLGIEVCALVGCSFGGMIALQFATTWPARVAALIVTDTSPAPESDRYGEAFRERERRMTDSEAIVRRSGMVELGKRAAAAVADPFLAEGIRRRYAAMKAEGFLGAARTRRERPNLIPLLREKLTMPVLICAGTDDPVKSACDVIAEELPKARYLTFKDSGHGVPSRRPQAFADVLLRFLTDVEDGTPVAGKRVV